MLICKINGFSKARTVLFTLFLWVKMNIAIAAIHDSVINQAIELNLALTQYEPSKEIAPLQQKMTAEIAKASYENALKIALTGLEKFPKNFLLQTYFAMILGDYASLCEGKLKQRMLEKSKFIFKKLMREVDTQPQDMRFYFKNEYYFRFAQYKKQYENGVARVNAYWGSKDWLAKGLGYYPLGMGGYYSQGVGASNFAYELYQKGNKKLAQRYAQKALVAWAQCFSYDNQYYNAYVHYALALGVLGNKQDMLRALQRGADLVHQDMNYPEFKKVMESF